MLIKKFPTTDVVLINAALESSNYEIDQAILFLYSMTPQDSEKYFAKTESKELLPKTTLICRQVQTQSNIEDLFGTLLVFKPKFYDIIKYLSNHIKEQFILDLL